MAQGVLTASVAMAHGINANQLHKWRYLYKKGEVGLMSHQSNGDVLELLPVRVALDAPLHKKRLALSAQELHYATLVSITRNITRWPF